MAAGNENVTTGIGNAQGLAAPAGQSSWQTVGQPMNQQDTQQVGDAQVFLSTSRPSTRRIRKTNVFLVGMFAVGVLCLYLLGLRNGPQEASAEEQAVVAQVDAAIQAMNTPDGSSVSATSQVVNTFYYEAKQRQIPVADIAGNPFVYRPTASPNTSQTANVSPQGVHQEATGQDFAPHKLKLQSVLMGARGATAMISSNVLTKGETIDGWTVVRISSREVLLARDGKQYVLRMP